jgi:hypothetical protein
MEQGQLQPASQPASQAVNPPRLSEPQPPKLAPPTDTIASKQNGPRAMVLGQLQPASQPVRWAMVSTVRLSAVDPTRPSRPQPLKLPTPLVSNHFEPRAMEMGQLQPASQAGVPNVRVSAVGSPRPSKPQHPTHSTHRHQASPNTVDPG